MKNSKYLKKIGAIIGVVALSFSAMQLENTRFLLSSLLQKPSYVFDGTVSPIDEMLDYSKLQTGDRNFTYNQLKTSGSDKFIPNLLSLYNQSNLTFKLDSVNFKNSDEVAKMNLQYNITVPFAGNYKLDSCGIGCGSHPGVDWVVLMDTPIKSIMIGEVVKTSEQSSGFGNHVVIKTEGAPHPSDSSKTTTLYSSYSHLSKIYVSKGQIVQAGEVIGLSGDTGTATTPHLDWQLALADTPWTPYWPFTWTEVSQAGLNFWSAVNAGLGKENMYKYTIDPALYVLKYAKTSFNSNPVVSEPNLTTETPIQTEVDPEILEELSEDLEQIEDHMGQSSIATLDIAKIDLDMPYFIMIGDKREIEVSLYDAGGQILKAPNFTDEIKISFSQDGIAQLNRTFLDKNDFQTGKVNLDLHGEAEGETNIIFEIGGTKFTSGPLNVISELQPFGHFGIASDGYFVPNVTEIIQVQAQSLNGSPTPKILGEGTVTLKVVKGEATLNPSKISTNDFINGIAEVELLSKSMDDIVVEVTYNGKSKESKIIEVQDFNDLSTIHEFYPAVSYLRSKGTITGYPDGSFQPDKSVSRIEALKMIFSGLDLKILSGKSVSFRDTVSNGEWYSDYLATASNMGVVQGYPDGSFKPTQGVNRVEFLKMLFASVDISVDPVVLSNPATDVDKLAWHAPYVQYAIEKNLFPYANSSTDFNPGQAMTRIEVAEVVYRFLVSLNNSKETYSVKLQAPGL